MTECVGVGVGVGTNTLRKPDHAPITGVSGSMHRVKRLPAWVRYPTERVAGAMPNGPARSWYAQVPV